ncbi:hypothetical protein CRG98_040932 [Punica granatum]|uniref:Uncharacterized protein n=1 Tax=Punica granatum TaxID=22663 RepID=A0A2I0I3W1_PUNGR|nr:hypothetical protein CRG98_040932 [Punica granatum]
MEAILVALTEIGLQGMFGFLEEKPRQLLLPAPICNGGPSVPANCSLAAALSPLTLSQASCDIQGFLRFGLLRAVRHWTHWLQYPLPNSLSLSKDTSQLNCFMARWINYFELSPYLPSIKWFGMGLKFMCVASSPGRRGRLVGAGTLATTTTIITLRVAAGDGPPMPKSAPLNA